jgi:hypothetical protein
MPNKRGDTLSKLAQEHISMGGSPWTLIVQACPSCGYSLLTASLSERLPECSYCAMLSQPHSPPSQRSDLRLWAKTHAAAGMVQARQVLELFAECDRLRSLNEDLAERVAKQSELLSRRAEKPI